MIEKVVSAFTLNPYVVEQNGFYYTGFGWSRSMGQAIRFDKATAEKIAKEANGKAVPLAEDSGK